MPIDHNLIFMSCGIHPARTIPFDSLYDALQNEIQKGAIIKTIDPTGKLELYSYTADTKFNASWNVYSLISRGLILCPGEKKVVATPFPAFANFSEMGYYVPPCGFSATNKMDGSLGIIWKHNDTWHVSTRGSFTSDQAKWAQDWLESTNSTKLLSGYTYLAEVIYKENRIVVPYDFEGLVLLSAYGPDGFEVDRNFMERTQQENPAFRLTEQRYFNSVDDIVKLCETLPFDQEGFVVRFDNGYRVKIKGEEYKRLHKIVSGITPIRIWENMVNGDNMTEISKIIPEELRQDLENIVAILSKKFDDIMAKIKVEHENAQTLTDKELGLLLKSRKGQMDEEIRNMIFLCRKKDLLIQAYIGGTECRKKVFGLFYPRGNKLQGYMASNSMNRLSEEE